MSPSPTTAPRVWQDSDLLNGSGMFQLRSLVSAKIRPSDYGADTSASWADMDRSAGFRRTAWRSGSHLVYRQRVLSTEGRISVTDSKKKTISQL